MRVTIDRNETDKLIALNVLCVVNVLNVLSVPDTFQSQGIN